MLDLYLTSYLHNTLLLLLLWRRDINAWIHLSWEILNIQSLIAYRLWNLNGLENINQQLGMYTGPGPQSPTEVCYNISVYITVLPYVCLF